MCGGAKGEENGWEMTEGRGRVNHIWMSGGRGGEGGEGGQWGEKYSRDSFTPFIGALEAIEAGGGQIGWIWTAM